MRRTTLPQSLLGVVGLLALASAGCGDWKTFIDEARDNGPSDPGIMTGSGGVSGGAVSCSGGVDANGVMCKRCVDASGAVVYEECSPDGTGSGGTTGTDPTATCTKITQGGPGSCKDYGIWKQYGSDTCAQQMMVLTELAPGPSCGGNSFESMTYVCCTPTPPPTNNVTCYESKDATGRPCKNCVDQYGKVVGGDCAMTAPPAQMCTTIDDGSPTSCKDLATWKAYGSDRCGQKNLTLVDLKVSAECNGGYAYVTYVCCGSGGTPPPDPVVSCGSNIDASGRVCKTCYDQFGMIISNDCPTTGGGEMCIKLVDGGPTSCKDAGTWTKYGTERCAQQNLSLKELVPQTMCAGGNYESVVYVCCGGSTSGGGTTGGSQTCVASANADGAMCETCTDQNGKVVYAKCYGGTTPQNEICDVKTNADGTQCKTCYYSDGSTVSDCPTAPPPK